MPIYECTFLVAKDNKEILKRLDAVIKKLELKVVKKDDWGVKPLAYAIRKLNEAKYIYMEIDMGTDVVKEFERAMQLEEELLRHLIVRA